MNLLATIRKFGPLSTAALWDDIRVMRLASPCQDLPTSEVDLLATLRALKRAGTLRLTERGWEAVYAEKKPEPTERRLFA